MGSIMRNWLATQEFREEFLECNGESIRAHAFILRIIKISVKEYDEAGRSGGWLNSRAFMFIGTNA